MNASMIVESILQRTAPTLPPSWCNPDSTEPTRWAREELAWSLLFQVLVHLLFSDPLPCVVRAGREHVPFSIDDATWQDFTTELGLHLQGVRGQLVERLAAVLRRETDVPTPQADLPVFLAGLVCLLDGFSRRGRGSHRSAPRQGSLGFDSAPSSQSNAATRVEQLLSWAGQRGAPKEDRYRIVFHVLWRPLSRRTWSDAVASVDPSPGTLSLPLDFLLRARTASPSVPEQLPLAPLTAADTSAAQAPLVTATGDALCASHAQDVLAVLLEPLLLLRGDPAASVAAAEATAHGFTRDMLRTWRRLLLADDLKFYGEPGSYLELKLPDRAWQLAKVPFRRSPSDRSQWVRVVRRGVMLKDDILLPGIAVIEDRPGGGQS